jgi:hypothetical protein
MKKLLLGTFLFGLVTGLCPQTFAKGVNLTCNSSNVEMNSEYKQYFGNNETKKETKGEPSKFILFIDISNNTGTIDGSKGELTTDQEKITLRIDENKDTNAINTQQVSESKFTINRKNLDFTYKSYFLNSNPNYLLRITHEGKGKCIKTIEKKENKI